MWKGFKEFIAKGNVIDLAVGIIIGGAFGKIVTSLVNDIIMPVVGLILGKIDFSQLKATFGSASIAYGNFIQSIVDFLIIALCIFMMIKLLSKLKKEKPAAPSGPPEPTKEEKLLAEIRDILKEKK